MGRGNFARDMPKLVLGAIEQAIELNHDAAKNYQDEPTWWDVELLDAKVEMIDPLEGQIRITTATGQMWLVTVEPE